MKKPIEEFFLLDQSMTLLKVTVFGKIPKEDRLGLRPGRVMEVTNGKIKEKHGVRYINVSYGAEGCKIQVLPKEDQRSIHILSSIGKKQKPRGNISRVTCTGTLNDLKNNGAEGRFEVRDCKVTNVHSFVYRACAKCKKKKKEVCENRSCTSKSNKSRNILGIKLTIEDNSTKKNDNVCPVMFGDIGTKSMMGQSADVFMRKTREEQKLLLNQTYMEKEFTISMYVNVKKSMWIIQDVQRKRTMELKEWCLGHLEYEKIA